MQTFGTLEGLLNPPYSKSTLSVQEAFLQEADNFQFSMGAFDFQREHCFNPSTVPRKALNPDLLSSVGKSPTVENDKFL